MNLEKLAYLILAFAAAAWALAAIVEVDWVNPAGALIALTVFGFGLLLFKAIRDRLVNAEDDHYDRSVER